MLSLFPTINQTPELPYTSKSSLAPTRYRCMHRYRTAATHRKETEFRGYVAFWTWPEREDSKSSMQETTVFCLAQYSWAVCYGGGNAYIAPNGDDTKCLRMQHCDIHPHKCLCSMPSLRIVTGLPTARRSTLGLEHISMLEFLYLTIPIEHPQWYCYTPIGLYQDVAVCSSFHLVLQLVLASGDFDKNTCTSSWRQSRISSCHSIGH